MVRLVPLTRQMVAAGAVRHNGVRRARPFGARLRQRPNLWDWFRQPNHLIPRWASGQNAPDFRGDAEDLAEIVSTLAENAVKWARSSVRIAAGRSDRGLRITMADDGPGSRADDRARLLARGAMLDETVPGHGLGLAIAADRIAAYGGQLDFGQTQGGGLTVSVELPARD